jgi:hypothetical protein
MENTTQQNPSYSKKDSPELEINGYKRTIKEARLVILFATLTLPFFGSYSHEGVTPVPGMAMIWGSILISLVYVALTFFVNSKPYTITLAALGTYILLLIVVACFNAKTIRSELFTELFIIYVFYHGLREYKKAEQWAIQSPEISS